MTAWIARTPRPHAGIRRGLAAAASAAAILAGQVFAGAADPPARNRLDLRLEPPPPAAAIQGEWIYRPLDGSESYLLTVSEARDGFFQFEARRQGQPRPVFRLDHAGPGIYRGETAEGFDACIPVGARFSLSASAERLLLEPAFPVTEFFRPAPPGPCRDAGRHVLSARGRDDSVHLRPIGDFGAPSSAHVDVRASEPQRPAGNEDPERRAISGLALGGPAAPDGAEVVLLGSVRDAHDRLWHHVRLVDPGVIDEKEGPPERGPAPGRPSSAVQDGSRPPEQRDAGSAGRERTVSGYVPADAVATRWICRLERPAGTEPP